MSISLIDTKQIRNFSSPTGVYTPTGWLVSGGLTISGLLSGLSGYFGNLTVQSLSVSGAIISPYLSGILGTTVTGSGIFMTLSPVDVSGNNIHFYHYLYTTNPNSPIQSFSSQDSQQDWAYFNNGSWLNFPAIGLSSTLQTASIVKHIFKPTGMDVFTKYFSEYKIIYAGNVTGIPANSLEFQSPTPGFTVAHIPFLAEYFATADSRYARKAQIGTDYVLSGVKVSGIPLVIQNFASIPASNHGTGTLIDVSGNLYLWDVEIGFTGYRPVTIFTGISVPSGGVITSANPIFSGQGTITTSLLSNNIVVISGASTSGSSNGVGNVTGIGVNNQSVLSTGGFIFSGSGNTSVTSGNTISGITTIIISSTSGSSNNSVGGVTGFALNSTTIFNTGSFYFSGSGNTTVTMVSGAPNVSGFIISSPVTSSIGNVTGIGANLNTPLFTGGFVVSGMQNLNITMTNVAAGISGVIIDDSFLVDQLTLQMFNTAGY